jgi:hypothetical protein
MQQQAARSNAAPWTTLTVLVVAAVMFAATGLFTSGEAAGHATGHLRFGLGVALLAVATLWLWRPRTSPEERLARTMFLGAALVVAAAQLLEAIGAFGYGPDNATVRTRPLGTLHDVASGLSLFALAFFGGSLVMALVALVTRLVRPRRGRAYPP